MIARRGLTRVPRIASFYANEICCSFPRRLPVHFAPTGEKEFLCVVPEAHGPSIALGKVVRPIKPHRVCPMTSATPPTKLVYPTALHGGECLPRWHDQHRPSGYLDFSRRHRGRGRLHPTRPTTRFTRRHHAQQFNSGAGRGTGVDLSRL